MNAVSGLFSSLDELLYSSKTLGNTVVIGHAGSVPGKAQPTSNASQFEGLSSVASLRAGLLTRADKVFEVAAQVRQIDPGRRPNQDLLKLYPPYPPEAEQSFSQFLRSGLLAKEDASLMQSLSHAPSTDYEANQLVGEIARDIKVYAGAGYSLGKDTNVIAKMGLA